MVALLVSGVIMAQKAAVKKEANHSFAFHAGPSFPVGDFKSTTLVNSSTGFLTNRESGFAKTGFTAGINYQYQLAKNVAFGANIFYNNHALNNKAFVEQLNVVGEGEFDATGLKLDHWQWYGVSVGPVFNEKVTDKITLGANVMFALANANSPRAVYQDITLVGEDWGIAPGLQTGIDFRAMVDKKMFVLVKADYLYMRPTFTIDLIEDGTTVVKSETHQKISVVNVSAGIGFNF